MRINKKNMDAYFKSRKHSIKKDLVNSYIIYDTNIARHFLISNGYSIVMVNDFNDTYIENEKYKYSIINMFEGFIDKNKNTFIETIDINTIIDNLNNDKEYKYNSEYAIDYSLLSKIINIIGCNKINILDNTNNILIEIIGRDNQIAYLLPMRVY